MPFALLLLELSLSFIVLITKCVSSLAKFSLSQFKSLYEILPINHDAIELRSDEH